MYRAAVASFLLVWIGCHTLGIERTEIPDEPIAFVYYPEDVARSRAEALSQGGTQYQRNRDRFEDRGVMNLGSLKNLLTDAFGAPDSEELYPGRIALFDPRSKDVTVVDSVRRGAIPLAWSDDHQRLLLTQSSSDSMQLFEFDRNSEEVRRLTHGPDAHPWGCYGPDGRLVAMVARRESDESVESGWKITSRIAVMDSDGSFASISSGPADRYPACAPDGTAVAYVASLDGEAEEIWVRSLSAASDARAIVLGSAPVFSPDSEWIVYTHRLRDISTLWRIRPEGSGRTRLGPGSGLSEFRPAISPNGVLVVYESIARNRSRLFVRRINGSGNRMLFSDGDGTHAVW